MPVRFALAGALVLAALHAGASVPTVHADTISTTAELILVEDMVFTGQDAAVEEGLFGTIVGVAVDSRGAVHILDQGFICVWKFSADGRFLQRYGAMGEGPGDFRRPYAIAIDGDDRVIVGGLGSLLAVFDAEGIPIDSYRRDESTLTTPVTSLAVDHRACVYVCSLDVNAHRVISKYDPVTFARIATFGDSYAVGHEVDARTERTFAGGYVAPAADPAELLYAQSAPPLVRIHGLGGAVLATIAVRGSDTGPPRSEIDGDRFTVYTPVMSATAIFGLGDGTILVSIAEPRLEDRISPTGFEGTIHLDQYDRSGRLLRSTARDRVFRPVGRDPRDRIYVSEYREIDGYECPVVVRYRVE